MKTLSKNEAIGVGVTLIVVLGLLLLGKNIFQNSSVSARNAVSGQNAADLESGADAVSQELAVADTVLGTGKEVKNGDAVSVHYTGALVDGSKFDSSYDRGEPISFTVGAGELIAGFDQGVVGMKVGGKRRITIPPELGYGARQAGSIPPNSTLVFEIELVKIGK